MALREEIITQLYILSISIYRQDKHLPIISWMQDNIAQHSSQSQWSTVNHEHYFPWTLSAVTGHNVYALVSEVICKQTLSGC